MIRNTVVAAAGAFLWFAGSADAITVSGLEPVSIAHALSATPSVDYSGVVELMIIRADLGISQCSGALLSDGYSILTAARCITDANGNAQATAGYVTFNLTGGAYQASVTRFDADPRFTGLFESPNDIAVLRLDAAAPAEAARYELYSGNALDSTVTVAGYGLGGNGVKGFDPIGQPFGTLRTGENRYDSTLPGEYLFDFDDGTDAHDALGGFGQGAPEAFIAPGDAGGPSFVDGRIAGVHSFTKRVLPSGASRDLDGALNSSFGEYAIDVSVAYNGSFIQAMMVAPEPKQSALLGILLVAISLLGHRRKAN